MADRVEREIEEILARLDTELPRDREREGGGTAPVADRQPISISNAREQRAKQAKRAARGPRRRIPLEPSTLLFTGAAVMMGGLILSTFAGSVMLWVAFAGVILFISAFLWSMFREAPRQPASGGPPRQGGKVFWRDRYIDVSPQDESAGSKLMRRIRRR